MAEKVPGDDGPSLELPSLFGRRKRARKEPAPVEPPPVQAQPVEPPPVQAQPVEPPAVQAQTAVLPVVEPRPQAEPAAPATRREPRQLPELAAGTAAVAVGAAVGLLGCVLTFLGLRGCELVTGTDSCGGPGLLVLVLIVGAMVLAGAAMLRLLRVPEAGNLSFLGVGILVVVSLVFLIDHLYEGWMFLAIPVLTALSYAIAAWVTSKADDDAASQREYRDERTYR